jgi:integrase
MANLKVSLLIRYRDSNRRWRRSPAARGKNGRVRPGYAQVGDEQFPVEPYTYDLRVHKGRMSTYVPVGANAADADAERYRRERKASALVLAADAGLKIDANATRETLRTAADRYIADAQARGASEAALQARAVLAEFQAVCRRTFMDEISREDVLRFHGELRKRGLSERSVSNKHNRIKSWFKFVRIDYKSILPPAPKYELALPTVYNKDHLSTLLGQAEVEKDQKLLMLIKVAGQTGLREQELQHIEWSDIDWQESSLRVRGKSKYGFRVKDSEQRDVPIPDDLLTALRQWKEQRDGKALVLGTDSDKPDSKMLRSIKRLAKRAGMNCGYCDGCKSANSECREFTLHKFRRTYCTSLLRAGLDLRTVQSFMGHADMESTMRYLRPASGSEIRERLNAVTFG